MTGMSDRGFAPVLAREVVAIAREIGGRPVHVDGGNDGAGGCWATLADGVLGHVNCSGDSVEAALRHLRDTLADMRRERVRVATAPPRSRQVFWKRGDA